MSPSMDSIHTTQTSWLGADRGLFSIGQRQRREETVIYGKECNYMVER